MPECNKTEFLFSESQSHLIFATKGNGAYLTVTAGVSEEVLQLSVPSLHLKYFVNV